MIEYEEDSVWKVLLTTQGSVLPKAFLWASPSILVAILLLYLDEWIPGERESLGLFEVTRSQLWAATTSIILLMLSFRTSQAFSRFWEGTGLLHQMRGEWFDTVSNCVTFSIGSKHSRGAEVMKFRHAIVRIMSLCHGSALEEISGNNIELESIDTFGLDDKTLKHLQECHLVYKFNKVEVMLHLLQSLITQALSDGIIEIPAPIVSRVYQTISRGFVNLLNAKKIQDTKFPFPYVQLIWFSLFALQLLTPCMMTVVIHSKVLAVVFTFLPMFGLYCLNFIAQELENPFGTDANDLPLQHFQTEMNNCLMMLLHPNSDLIVGVSDERCEMDFHRLRDQVCLSIQELEEMQKSKEQRLSQFVGAKSPRGGDSGEDSGSELSPRSDNEIGKSDSESYSSADRSPNKDRSSTSSRNSGGRAGFSVSHMNSGGEPWKDFNKPKKNRLSEFDIEMQASLPNDKQAKPDATTKAAAKEDDMRKGQSKLSSVSQRSSAASRRTSLWSSAPIPSQSPEPPWGSEESDGIQLVSSTSVKEISHPPPRRPSPDPPPPNRQPSPQLMGTSAAETQVRALPNVETTVTLFAAIPPQLDRVVPAGQGPPRLDVASSGSGGSQNGLVSRTDVLIIAPPVQAAFWPSEGDGIVPG